MFHLFERSELWNINNERAEKILFTLPPGTRQISTSAAFPGGLPFPLKFCTKSLSCAARRSAGLSSSPQRFTKCPKS